MGTELSLALPGSHHLFFPRSARAVMRLLKVVWVFFPSMGYTQLWFRNTGLKQSSQICCFHSFLLDAFFIFSLFQTSQSPNASPKPKQPT